MVIMSPFILVIAGPKTMQSIGYHLAILISFHQFIFCAPEYIVNKLSVTLEIGVPLERGIKKYKHESIHVFYSFRIEENLNDIYRIGQVKYGKQIIAENNPTIYHRNVTLVRKMDGTVYLQLNTIYELVKNFTIAETLEFKKVGNDEFRMVNDGPGIAIFRNLKRKYVDLNFAIFPQNSGLIEVFHDTRTDTKSYFISNLLKEEVSIGIVRYGDYIIDDRAKGVIYKEVTATKDNEFIIVESLLTDGFIVRILYRRIQATHAVYIIQEDKVEYDVTNGRNWFNIV